MSQLQRIDQGGLVVASARLDELGTDQLEEWKALHRAQKGVTNPFSSPTWVSGWYRHFVPRPDRRLLWITQRDRLVGVAPLHVQGVHVSRVPVARRACLVGAGRTTALEIPSVLVLPRDARAVVRAVAEQAMSFDVTWVELVLSREQGWLDAHLAGTPGRPAFQQNQQVRVCVVLRLGETWEATRSSLKRNVKESVRRARNRLAKDGRPYRIVHRTGGDLDYEAVERLLRLHGDRSLYQGSSEAHHNAYADRGNAFFVRDVLPRLGREGEATITELELDGEVVASLLVLHPPGGIYFHSSGFRPDTWQLSPVTALQAAAMERAIQHGDRWVNFSPGPNEAKLRWSDELVMFDDYAFGVGTPVALARYVAFHAAKNVRELRHERQFG